MALLQLLGTGLVTAVEDRLENPMARTGVGGWVPLGVSCGALIKRRHLKTAQCL